MCQGLVNAGKSEHKVRNQYVSKGQHFSRSHTQNFEENPKDEEMRKESKGRLESRQSGEKTEWGRLHGLLVKCGATVKEDVCEARNDASCSVIDARQLVVELMG